MYRNDFSYFQDWGKLPSQLRKTLKISLNCWEMPFFCSFKIFTGMLFGPDSDVTRAILKLVYRFGIPNSNPQMLKSVDFWYKLLSMFLVTEPRERCFELFRMENSQWVLLGRAYSAAPDSGYDTARWFV